MSVTSSGQELSASSVIGLIESGAYPREVVATIARGFLPLAQEDLIGVLAYLALGEDPEIVELARASLHDIPTHTLAELAANENLPVEHLVRLLRVSPDPVVTEALIRNRSVPDEAVAEVARHAEPRVQEVIVINHARILRMPEILEALLGNPALTVDVRRRANEAHEEFFVKQKAREDALAELEVVDLPLEPIADLLERAEEQPDDASFIAITEVEKSDERAAALWTRLTTMTVAEKVRLAYRGDKTIRLLLVRDRNKLISSAVMRNPRMTEQEAEAVAGMRNVDDEVLRILATRRQWTTKYNIVLALVRNPKAPVGVVLPFINRLTLRDLKGLKDDRGVQQAVREMAKKVYAVRSTKIG